METAQKRTPRRSRSRSRSIPKLKVDSVPSSPVPATPTPVEQEYPPSFNATEPLTTPHTVSVLIALVVFVGYAALSRIRLDTTADHTVPGSQNIAQIADKFTNIKTGIFMSLGVGLLFCMEHLRDTLFIRPHPALWRAVTGIGMFYFMFMAFLLFQDMDTIQAVFKALDPGLTGKPVPERSYAEDCSFTYDSISKACDRFLIAHALGWFGKQIMLRDTWLCIWLSFVFEILEYLFTFLQPNFAECWWDHWILDFFGCNLIGILIGHYTLMLVNGQRYNWSGFSEYKTIGGKIRRGIMQFTPYSYTPYNWKMFRSFRRFLGFLSIGLIVIVTDLNAFFLKDLLWVPPESPLNVYRLFLWWGFGLVAVRDLYHFVDNPNVKRFGASIWVTVGAAILEFLIVFKFAVMKYSNMLMPDWVKVFWVVTGGLFAVIAGWWFTIGKREYEQARLKRE